MSTTLSFNPITYGGESFTNISVTEVDTGTVAAFSSAHGTILGASTPNGPALTWGAVNAGVYYANSSEVLNFNYTATANAGELIAAGQQYSTDVFTGPGVSLVAVEKIYSTSGALLGTSTFTQGQQNAATFQLSTAEQSVNVQVTLTMSISSAGTQSSEVLISAIQQSFGYTAAPPNTASIGDIVFLDSSGSGLESSFDSGPGIAGVTVELLNATGTSVLATTTTNSTGAYNFSSLAAGVYEVAFIKPTGYNFTTQGVGTNSAINSSANQITGITAPITLTAGQADHNVEAGLVAGGSGAGSSGTIGATVWFDSNGDGLDNNNEAGVAGVTVELLDSTGKSILATTTDSSGGYNFTNLSAGTYEVQFLAPAGDAFTTENAALTGGATINSAANSAGMTAAITLTAGQVDDNVNAGLVPTTGTVTGTVFTDANGDGAQDNAETGAAGVTVNLLNAAGTSVIATATTNASGTYSFGSVSAGSYEVQVVAPSGDGFSTASTDPVTVAAGATTTAPSVGIYAPATVTGEVWLDKNGDGLLDNSEAGVAGTTVELLNAAGTSVIATTTTNGSGSYSFAGLEPAAYRLKVVAPAGDSFTTQGALGGTDSLVNQSTGTVAIMLTSGETLSANAGVYAPTTITGSAFLDLNRDGLIDDGESNLAGVTVDLWNASKTSVLATTTTNSSGTYSFSGLAPSTYEVSFVAPAGDILTTQGTAFGSTDSSANATTGFTPAVTLTSGQTQANVDAGFQIAPPPPPAPACIEGEEWLDSNGNGILNAGEPGVAGQTVTLLSDTLTLKISEDAYLGDAQYTVFVNGAQVGGVYTATALHNMGQDNTLSLNGIWGASACVTVNFLNDAWAGTAQTDRNLYVDGVYYNGVNQNASAALYCAGPVSGTVCSGTALQTIATTTTNAAGNYSFTNINPGVYEVAFTAPSGDVFTTQGVGGNPAVDSSASTCNGITAPITVTAGQCDMSVNAGVYGTATISGSTFIDTNNNGVFDSTDYFSGGFTVDLWNATGTTLIATTTSSSGFYSFSNLAPGVYQESFIGFSATELRGAQGATGFASGTYSTANQSTGFTAPITVTSGQTQQNVDEGFYTPATIEGTAFLDLNRNGIGDAGDTNPAGVTMSLLNAAGTSVLATTTTASNGFYSFAGLQPGVYQVQATSPSGDFITTQNASGSVWTESVFGSNGLTGPISLTSGATSIDNVGFQVAPPAAPAPASLGNFVWLDTNGNGIQDAGEAGVAGATVSLLSDTLVLKMSEDAYAGDAQYTVSVNGVQIGGAYTVTALHSAGQDSYVTLNGIWGAAPTVSISFINDAYAGTPQTDRNLYIDGVFYNGGLQTIAGSLYSNGTVGGTVYGSAEPVIATATTNASGYYTFANLNPGAYEVKFAAPAGDVFTTQNAGSNPAVDSNANQSTGISAPVTPAAGQSNTTIDAGVYAPASITGVTFFDANGNGYGDAGDSYLPGVTVNLWNGTGTSLIATTVSTGNTSFAPYAFTGLAPGAYEVSFVAPSGYAFTNGTPGVYNGSTSDESATTGFTAPITLSSGQTQGNVVGGFVLGNTITGFAFQDLNRNGIYNTSEPYIGGLTVDLWNATGTSLIATTTTNSSGSYTFGAIANGTYEVSISGLTGETLDAQGIGGNAAIDSAFNPSTGFTNAFSVGAGQTVQANAGYSYNAASISSYVFYDTNKNGISDDPNNMASGITVDLWNGTGTSLIAATTTNSGGEYFFAGLNPGSYEISVVLPGGYTFDPYHATPSGYTATNQSNINPSTGFSPAFSLTAGQSFYNLENVGLETAGTSTSSLKVLKIPSATVVNQCGQVTYTFTVTNTGTTALSNVCIVDNIGSVAKPDYVVPTLVTTGTNGTLAAGATWTYTETVNQINSTLNNCGTVSHTCSGNFLDSGHTAWLSSSFNPTSCANGATYKFQGVTCQISGGGTSSPIKINCGDAVVTFSNACTKATTVWNAGQNCWVTTLPAGSNPGNVFLSGCPLTIPNGTNLSGATCTWTVGDSSNNCGLSNLSWGASACGFSTFDANNVDGRSDYNNIGVKSCDNLGGSLACGAPVTQLVANNCGKSNYNTDDGSGESSQNCGTGSSGTPNASGAADTVTVTATTTTGAQATASDTKEVQVLGTNSDVSVGGTVPTGALASLYGTPDTLEFLYNPGNSISSGTNGAISGTNTLSSAYMVIENAAQSTIYFQGAVTAGENIFADATLNPLTNTPTGQTFASTDGGNAIFALIYASQAAYKAGAAAIQYDGYSGINGTMHLGDTIGSVQLVGYVGSTGGHLV